MSPSRTTSLQAAHSQGATVMSLHLLGALAAHNGGPTSVQTLYAATLQPSPSHLNEVVK